jgi:retron-type reverse transcriptase
VKNPNKYRSSPLKRIWLEKPNSKDLRPISIPSYIDRCVQHLYINVLTVFHEQIAEPHSFGFQSFRSPGWTNRAIIDFIHQRFNKFLEPPKYAVELDIAKCFNSISHDFIVNKVGQITLGNNKYTIIPPNILSQWLTNGYIDIKGTVNPYNQIIPTTVVVPQGGPISPTISNIVINGIEKTILDSITNKESKKSVRELITPQDDISWYYYNKLVYQSTNLKSSQDFDRVDKTIEIKIKKFYPPKKPYFLFSTTKRTPISVKEWINYFFFIFYYKYLI